MASVCVNMAANVNAQATGLKRGLPALRSITHALAV
jgi:hypothetical protein